MGRTCRALSPSHTADWVLNMNQFALQEAIQRTPLLRWSPDGRSLIYANMLQGEANLWRLPLDAGPPQPVTNFKDANPERIWSFGLSRDGKQLIIARGDRSDDVVLISEVK